MKLIDERLHEENVKLLAAVRRWKCLYDVTSPDYSVKQQTIRSWAAVGKEVGFSEKEARLRWRNLRISYLRYLRLASKTPDKRRKPYYLAREMRFMEPFIRNQLGNASLSNISTTDADVGDDNVSECDPEDFIVEDPEPETEQEQEPEPVIKTERTHRKRAEKKEKDDLEETNDLLGFMNELSHDPLTASVPVTTVSVLPASQSSDSHSQLLADLSHPDLAFFRSLIPDMQQMTNAQKSKFKAAVLTNLNEILYP